jgi:hypothetical protein
LTLTVAFLPRFPSAAVLVHTFRPAATRDAMNAAAMQARVKRLTALIEGLSKEADAVHQDRGDMPLLQWNRYYCALLNARDALCSARSALQEASDRQQAGRDG